MIIMLSDRSLSNAHFSRLTPSQVLFIPPSNTVLAHAQSQTRPSPHTFTTAGAETLHAFGTNVASFLSSRDTVESFAKLAQNLLRLSTANQVIFTLSPISRIFNFLNINRKIKI